MKHRDVPNGSVKNEVVTIEDEKSSDQNSWRPSLKPFMDSIAELQKPTQKAKYVPKCINVNVMKM